MAGGQHDENSSDSSNSTTRLIFSPSSEDMVSSLAECLGHFKKYNIKLTHIESRSSLRFPNRYEFMVECVQNGDDLNAAIESVKKTSNSFNVIPRHQNNNSDTVPWFPHRMRDLDEFTHHIQPCGSELDSDHPGFTDPVYRARRKYFADLASSYKHGQPLPRIEYTKEETETWGKVYRQLTQLYPTHACKEFNHAFPLLMKHCGYSESNIPQFEDISNFLKDSTGFTLRPVAGLMAPRDFFAGLAFRVLHSTQYIRHSSVPLYTPEPDVCHGLLGHVPLFADEAFAQFSQEFGLASLGAPDEVIEKLTTCYWFTVEFGLCKQDGQLKAFGAGLLSSFGELQYCLSDEPELKPLEPEVTAIQKYPVLSYQPLYFVAESFEDATEKMRKFARTVPRKFGVRFNPYTQSIDILDSKQQLEQLAQIIRNETGILKDSLSKIFPPTKYN